MTPPTVAALLTVFNRKAHTLACLEALAAQGPAAGAEVRVVLVDDGSRDGTAAAVRERFPAVQVVDGSGQLYWNGGMRLAFATAMEGDPDFYLLLNDDTRLAPDALARLLATHAQKGGPGRPPCLVVGSTVDPGTGLQSYGGWTKGPWWNPAAFRLVAPGPEPLPCHTLNCNIALVPRDVAERAGNLDPAFTHSMGDIDYGLRALRAGCALWVAPGFLGECAANTGKGLWSEGALGPRELWKRLLGPKGLPPSEWGTFTSRHYGPFWPVHFAWPYAKAAGRALGLARRRR